MDILQNPFHILGATTRDNSQKIMELDEECSLSMDSNVCTQARSILTHPRRRLSAEVAWLPGVAPKRVGKLLKMLESSVENLIGMDTLMRVKAAFKEVQRTRRSMVINGLTLSPGLVRFESEGRSGSEESPTLTPTMLALFLFAYFKNHIAADRLIPIAQANLLVAGLSRVPDYSSEHVGERLASEWIVEIANIFEAIDPKVVRKIINEERIVSGFSTVTDLSAIEAEIKERRNHYSQIIISALNCLSPPERARAVTVAVERTTNNGENLGPILINDLVNSYELDTQGLLEKEEGNISELSEQIRTAADGESPDSVLAPMVNQLSQAVKNWDIFAQPIQINRRIQGLSHDPSSRVAGHVRRLAVDLFNEYGKLEFARQITDMLQEVFAEVGEVAARLAEDVQMLAEFAEQRKQRVKIEELIGKLKAAADEQSADSILAPMVNQIIQVINNLDTTAQSVEDHLIATRVRDLAVGLFNKHDKLDFARQITYTLQRVFAEVDELAERFAQDARALDRIAEQRLRLIEAAKKREEEWRKEITYEADVGLLFRHKLRISPEGIEWRGDRWDLDSITRIRWGGTRHSLNGIPTGTTYSIIFGNKSNYTSIELKDEIIYTNFIDRLWRTVGVRLLTEYLEGLREGKKYRFGSAVISDHGVELERKRLFLSNEQVFCRWSDLTIWNDAGVCCIGKREDRKLKASFSYQYEDNIHVLEAAVRMFWKRGGDRLSNLLEK